MTFKKTVADHVVDPFLKGWRETPGPLDMVKRFAKGFSEPGGHEIWDNTIGALIKGFREKKFPKWLGLNRD